MLYVADFYFQAGEARISNHCWSQRTSASAAAAPAAVRRGASAQFQPHRIHWHVDGGVLHSEHVILAAPVPTAATRGPRLDFLGFGGFDFAAFLVLIAFVVME